MYWIAMETFKYILTCKLLENRKSFMNQSDSFWFIRNIRLIIVKLNIIDRNNYEVCS